MYMYIYIYIYVCLCMYISVREAKAAWSLIMDNFEEFKKERDLHVHMFLYMSAYI